MVAGLLPRNSHVHPSPASTAATGLSNTIVLTPHLPDSSVGRRACRDRGSRRGYVLHVRKKCARVTAMKCQAGMVCILLVGHHANPLTPRACRAGAVDDLLEPSPRRRLRTH